MSRVTISSDFSALSAAEIVVESTVEDLAVKRQVICESKWLLAKIR